MVTVSGAPRGRSPSAAHSCHVFIAHKASHSTRQPSHGGKEGISPARAVPTWGRPIPRGPPLLLPCSPRVTRPCPLPTCPSDTEGHCLSPGQERSPQHLPPRQTQSSPRSPAGQGSSDGQRPRNPVRAQGAVSRARLSSPAASGPGILPGGAQPAGGGGLGPCARGWSGAASPSRLPGPARAAPGARTGTRPRASLPARDPCREHQAELGARPGPLPAPGARQPRRCFPGARPALGRREAAPGQRSPGSLPQLACPALRWVSPATSPQRGGGCLRPASPGLGWGRAGGGCSSRGRIPLEPGCSAGEGSWGGELMGQLAWCPWVAGLRARKVGLSGLAPAELPMPASVMDPSCPLFLPWPPGLNLKLVGAGVGGGAPP